MTLNTISTISRRNLLYWTDRSGRRRGDRRGRLAADRPDEPRCGVAAPAAIARAAAFGAAAGRAPHAALAHMPDPGRAPHSRHARAAAESRARIAAVRFAIANPPAAALSSLRRSRFCGSDRDLHVVPLRAPILCRVGRAEEQHLPVLRLAFRRGEDAPITGPRFDLPVPPHRTAKGSLLSARRTAAFR
jgi:hypothetical protein